MEPKYKYTDKDSFGNKSYLLDDISLLPYLPTDTTEGDPDYAFDSVSKEKCPIGSSGMTPAGEVVQLFPSGWKILGEE